MRILKPPSKIQRLITPAALLLLIVALTVRPVGAQAPFGLTWAFDYSPLVTGASNSLLVSVNNAGSSALRVVSVGIHFSWMEPNAYITNSSSFVVQVNEVGECRIPFNVSNSLITGKYSMDTLVAYQLYQTTGWGGTAAIVYALTGINVLGQPSPYQLTFDPYDLRIYSVIIVLLFVGWYVPRKLEAREKGRT